MPKTNVQHMLRELMVHHNLTTRQIATHLGVSDSAVRNYITGLRVPQPEIAKSIADLYETVVNKGVDISIPVYERMFELERIELDAKILIKHFQNHLKTLQELSVLELEMPLVEVEWILQAMLTIARKLRRIETELKQYEEHRPRLRDYWEQIINLYTHGVPYEKLKEAIDKALQELKNEFSQQTENQQLINKEVGNA